MRRGALLALGLLAVGWALTLWVAPWSDERVNDLFVYRSYAEPVLAGALPYRDVFSEYPPLASAAIVLPGLMGTDAEAFRLAFAGWTLALAAAAREPFPLAVVAVRNAVLLAALVLAVRALQPRRQQQLLDRGRPALAVRLE